MIGQGDLGRALSHPAPHAGRALTEGDTERLMHTSLPTRISGLLQQILAQSGWWRSELRRLDQAGHGHRCMRNICELLDSLDSGIHWDLPDELLGLSGPSSPQAARILDWLGADIEPLERQLSRVGEQCPGHPLATVARLVGGEIISLYRDIQDALGPASVNPDAAPGAAGNRRPRQSAAEASRLC